MHQCSCGERYHSARGALDCERSHVRHSKKDAINVAHGTVEASGLTWCIMASKRATNRDLRSISALLLQAAERLEEDPEAVDTRITV